MSTDIQIIQPPVPRNRLYHLIGLGMLAMNSWRHRIQGYKTPRPWFSQDASRILEYDRAVYTNWRRHLDDYLQFDFDLEGRNVVELGPGTDLGTGLLWLADGAGASLLHYGPRGELARRVELPAAWAAPARVCAQPGGLLLITAGALAALSSDGRWVGTQGGFADLVDLVPGDRLDLDGGP